MEHDQIKRFESTTEVEKAVGNKDISQVKDFDFADVGDLKGRKFDYLPEGVSVILSTDTIPQLATLWDRRQLVEFAKQVLRRYEPTAEEQILDTLNEIKARLPELPQKGT